MAMSAVSSQMLTLEKMTKQKKMEGRTSLCPDRSHHTGVVCGVVIISAVDRSPCVNSFKRFNLRDS